MKRISNLQFPISNLQSADGRLSGDLKVGRRTLRFLSPLFIACLGGGFAVRLYASEPSDFQTSNQSSESAVTANSAVTPETGKLPPRAFTETDLVELLTSTLQREYVKDKGELELHLTRPWTTRNVPNEPLTIKIQDLPPNGVTASFITRCELRTARESLGSWQISAQARIWRDVWVARSYLKRGELVADSQIEQERRDILSLHEPLAEFSAGDTSLELSESLQPGSPLLARSVKVHPVIRRGQSADALVQEGSLSITMKVEALEDGAPGQTIRVRNSQSRRDIHGKVLDEKTILVSL